MPFPCLHPVPLFRRYLATFDTTRPVLLLFRIVGEEMVVGAVVLALFGSYLRGDAEATEMEEGTDVEIDAADVEDGHPAWVDELLDEHWFLLGVLAAPIMETLLLQSLWYELVRRFTKSAWIPFVLIWALFASLHFFNSVLSGTIAGVIVGFYLTLVYHLFRSRSVYAAILWTFLAHASYNLIVSALE